MTRQRDLKRRVRARQARTGESYVTALRHVRTELDTFPAELAMPPSEPIPVIELVDVTELGAALGLKCRLRLAPDLAERVDAADVLRTLYGVLTATVSDLQLAAMRDVVLHNVAPVAPPGIHAIQDSLRFARRVRAGIGGISDSGYMLALAVTGRHGAELVVFMLWLSTVSYAPVPPTLIIASSRIFDADGAAWDSLAFRAVPRLP